MRPVVVTGYGAITSIGYDADSFWQSLCDGKSKVKPIERFDASLYRSSLGSEVDWDVVDGLFEKGGFGPIKEDATKLAVLAIQEAVNRSNIDLDLYGDKVGCMVGTLCSSGKQQLDRLREIMNEDPFFMDCSYDDFTDVSYQANTIASIFNIKGVTSVVSTACASSIDAYGYGLDLIRDGTCDVVVVAGGDIIVECVHAGFNSIFAVSSSLPRPFDENRSGIVIGDGAAAIILESESHALQRGAPIFARALGYGANNSAFNLVSPTDDGVPEALAMKMAIKDSGLSPDSIQYVIAHGTGTPKNDQTELLAVDQAFDLEKRVSPLRITSNKANMGHCMGAAGVISLVSAIGSINHQLIPPTSNLASKDPLFGELENIELVYGESLSCEISNILINSLGFAGNNAVAIMGVYNGKN